MKWLLPAAIVLITSAVGIIPAWREHGHAIGRVAMVTCAEDAGNEAAGSPSQTLRFQLAAEIPGQWAGVSAEQLVALGFDRADAAQRNQTKRPHGRSPFVRAAWARLRPDSARGGRLVVEELGLTRASVWRDSASIVARIRLGWNFRELPPTPGDTTANRRPPQDSLVFQFGVLELIPWSLHITADQDRAIRQVNAGKECRGSRLRAMIANGPGGGLWVERVVTR